MAMAVTTSATPTWESVFVLHFGTKALKHIRLIKTNICAVNSHLKPSYLWDEFMSPAEKVREFVSDLKAASILCANLHVLVVGEDVFILSLVHVERNITVKLDLPFPLLDVSPSLKSPKCASVDTLKLVQRHFARVVKQLQIPKNPALENGNNPTELIRLELEPECNGTTLYGALLNYPVIYWYDTSREMANVSCLSMQPLRVFSVVTKMVAEMSIESAIYSFSAPESLAEEFEPVVKNWFNDLVSRFPMQSYFEDLDLRTKTVSSGCVAM